MNLSRKLLILLLLVNACLLVPVTGFSGQLEKGLKAYNKQDYKKALSAFQKAAGKGDVQAYHNLGLMYAKGNGVTQSYTEAEKWYKMAADKGLADSQYNLGLLYGQNKIKPESAKQVADLMLAAGRQGHAGAQFLLGILYEGGEADFTQSYTEAGNWYFYAAAKGNAAASNKLDEFKASGKVSANLDPVAAKANFNKGKQAYAAKNNNQAVELFRQSADQGSAQAKTLLGKLYEVGEGVPQSYAKAQSWYLKAVEQGDANAQVNLGVMYINGDGVEKSYKKASDLFIKASDQGNSEAMFHIGSIYLYGLGVPESEANAIGWYKQAAALGNQKALNSLNKLGSS